MVGIVLLSGQEVRPGVHPERLRLLHEVEPETPGRDRQPDDPRAAYDEDMSRPAQVSTRSPAGGPGEREAVARDTRTVCDWLGPVSAGLPNSARHRELPLRPVGARGQL